MSTLTIADFRARFSSFASTSDSDIQIQIDSTAWQFELSDWDTNKYLMAHSLLVAHELTITSRQVNGNTGSNGPLKSRSVDGASETYATSALDGDASSVYLSSTSYGQRYLSMLKSNSFRRCFFTG